MITDTMNWEAEDLDEVADFLVWLESWTNASTSG
jgi:hypothetical protein